jgi:ribosomal-protein-alanine N-acetyltransferase
VRFPLTTDRLRLRPLTGEDLGALTAVYTHPAVMRWIGANTPDAVAEELEQQLAHQAAHGYSFWAVEDRETGRFLGDCGLQPLERHGPEVELGYDLHPDAWGRGIATEAARAVVADAFARLGLDELVAVVRPDNVGSRRVLEKSGFHRVRDQVAYGIPMVRYEIAR